MNIIFLGPNEIYQRAIIDFLIRDDNSVERYDRELTEKIITKKNYDFLISFGYRYIIKNNILELLKNKSINLHISYLPWNRGSDPNFWSVVEDTPKGVTIHQIDKDLDKGRILFQKKVDYNDSDTLRSSYEKLNKTIVDLFLQNWDLIKNNKVKPRRQKGIGSYHRSSEKNRYFINLTEGWDTKLYKLKGLRIND